MFIRARRCILAMVLLSTLAAAPVERIKNDKVRIIEQALAADELLALPKDHPTIIVYLDDGAISEKPVKRGDTLFFASKSADLKNSGKTPLRLVVIELLNKESPITWGSAGLAPAYKMLFENAYVRAYDVKIPAGTQEPLHTHKDRAVVCLSGADLEHILPDGHKETSSLKTGEIAYRHGSTHVGSNIGKTDLWVIAIEPK